MKKILKVCTVVILFVFVLTSCAGTLVNLKFDTGKLINKSLRLSYHAAPYTYQPVSIGEAYAYCKSQDLTLYSVIGADESDWLTEQYSGRTTTVFYSDEITLPTLSELSPDKIYVCTDAERTYAISTIEDKDTIHELIDIIETGEKVEWPYSDPIKSYELKFNSDDNLPFLFYNLIYGEFPEGKFIYNFTTKEAVAIGEVLSEYIK
ncbi:MAG: hypothetical protein E7672_06905 [Ruminococcaceae bacterium]|nr:hypothetical protein [Oscillospiraceae bacterium]